MNHNVDIPYVYVDQWKKDMKWHYLSVISMGTVVIFAVLALVLL